MIIYDRYDADSKARAKSLMKDLIDEGARLGMGEYRTHLALQDQVMGTYSYNDGSLLKMHDMLKDALDPNGIMAPGKSGIWGKNWVKMNDAQHGFGSISSNPLTADPRIYGRYAAHMIVVHTINCSWRLVPQGVHRHQRKVTRLLL